MSRRRPAFDPDRLDDLEELLPTPAPMPLAAATPAPAAPDTEPDPARVDAEQPDDGSRPEPASPRPRRARGQGGRPTHPSSARQSTSTPEAADGTRVPVAVRIPRPLYEDVNTRLLAGPERASYGQLVVWTCEDHPDEVAAGVRAARPQPGSRRPRGRRLAADTVQVTLRLTAEERSLVDTIAELVRATHPGLITRTEVAAAALSYALEVPPTQ